MLWGLYYGVLLALEKFVWGRALEKLPRFLRHLYAFLIVVFGFVIFVFDDFTALQSYVSTMFCLGRAAGTAGSMAPAGQEFFWYAGQNEFLILTAFYDTFQFH